MYFYSYLLFSKKNDLSLVFDGKNSVSFTVHEYDLHKHNNDVNDDFSDDIIFNTHYTKIIMGEGESYRYSCKSLHFKIQVKHFSIEAIIILHKKINKSAYNINLT